jgi:hypothetical protein
MRTVNYEVVRIAAEWVLIRDAGPWDRHLTVTNGADLVVEQLAAQGLLDQRRLFYIDSEGDCDEIVVEHGQFVRFNFLSQEWRERLLLEATP